MEFLYLCHPFPLEFLCVQAEIIHVNGGSRCLTQIKAASRNEASAGIVEKSRSEHSHDGRRDGGARVWLLRCIDRVCLRVRTALREIEP